MAAFHHHIPLKGIPECDGCRECVSLSDKLHSDRRQGGRIGQMNTKLARYDAEMICRLSGSKPLVARAVRCSVAGCLLLLSLFFFPSLLLPGSTRRRFYPQRSSGQAVVTGVVPSPRYEPSFLSRIGFSIPTASRLSSNVTNSRSRAFRESICAQEKVLSYLKRVGSWGTRTHAIDSSQQVRG